MMSLFEKRFLLALCSLTIIPNDIELNFFFAIWCNVKYAEILRRLVVEHKELLIHIWNRVKHASAIQLWGGLCVGGGNVLFSPIPPPYHDDEYFEAILGWKLPGAVGSYQQSPESEIKPSIPPKPSPYFPFPRL